MCLTLWEICVLIRANILPIHLHTNKKFLNKETWKQHAIEYVQILKYANITCIACMREHTTLNNITHLKMASKTLQKTNLY